MRITKEQLKQIIREELSEMRIDTVAGHASDQGIPRRTDMTPEQFANKYDLEVEVRPEDGMKVIYHWDDDAWSIMASDVPEHWDSESAGQPEKRVFETNEFVGR